VGKRHRRIRARGATGQVAGAATEKHGLEAHRANRPAQHAFSQGPWPSRPSLNPNQPNQQPQNDILMPRQAALRASRSGRIIERSGTSNPAALVIESLSGGLLRRLRVGRQRRARAGMRQRVSARSRAWERRRRTLEPPTIGKGEHASLRCCGSACSRTCDRSGARASDGKQHSGCVPGHAVVDGGRPAAARCSEPKRAGREDRSRARSRDSPEMLTAA
jgi:hypothetical protein